VRVDYTMEIANPSAKSARVQGTWEIGGTTLAPSATELGC
jgi:hypothetical protein